MPRLKSCGVCGGSHPPRLDGLTGVEWLAQTFEFEFCAECGGDARHHTAAPLLGHWFAHCDYPPLASGATHPKIRRYRAEA